MGRREFTNDALYHSKLAVYLKLLTNLKGQQSMTKNILQPLARNISVVGQPARSIKGMWGTYACRGASKGLGKVLINPTDGKGGAACNQRRKENKQLWT